MVWLISPTCISMSTRDCCPTWSTIPPIVDFLNPRASASSRYGPGFSAAIRKVPDSSVTTLRARLVSMLTAVTLTLGTSAPVGSLTTPVSTAVGTWANDTPTANSMPASDPDLHWKNRFFMTPLLLLQAQNSRLRPYPVFRVSLSQFSGISTLYSNDENLSDPPGVTSGGVGYLPARRIRLPAPDRHT